MAQGPTYPKQTQEEAKSRLQLGQEKRDISITTGVRERKSVLVVSQTRQDIASRAYVSHLDMRIRVAVVRLRRDKGSRLQLGQEKGEVSIATRAREKN